jgi:hypothetical protein
MDAGHDGGGGAGRERAAALGREREQRFIVRELLYFLLNWNSYNAPIFIVPELAHQVM